MSHLVLQPIHDNFDYLSKVSFKNNIFSDKKYAIAAELLEGDILRLDVNYSDNRLPRFSQFEPLAGLSNNKKITFNKNTVTISGETTAFSFDLNTFAFTISENGKQVLDATDGFIGFCKDKTVFKFNKPHRDMPFWGLGSKLAPFNKTGQMVQNWNIDVHYIYWTISMRDDYDPGYVTIPIIYTKINGTYLVLLLDNPTKTYFNFGSVEHRGEEDDIFYFGSYNGHSTLYVMTGNTLAEAVQKAVSLYGTHEMPPVWSLGHHQCRFSYLSQNDAKSVVDKYEINKLPLDVLWLDIDYMEQFKIFTWNQKYYSDPEGLSSYLHERGMRLITMIDPGVKKEKGYPIYDSGVKNNVFCKTPIGTDYVGYVWPGKTVYPDFSLERVRTWWSKNITDFVKTGVDGVWIDMNDPSTESVDVEDMLWQEGKVSHELYHNQYGNGMAISTKQGLLDAHPNERPFVLTRSAYIGAQRNAAVWTGDNYSSYELMRASIRQCVSLALSGVSFSGPDIGGFLGVADEKMMVRWYQSAILFPFFRNHNIKAGYNLQTTADRPQEPYAFSKEGIELMRTAINTRYKLLPYIYNVFCEHVKNGAPMMRPIFYEIDDERFYNIDDQFMLGKSLLHAPVVTEQDDRTVTLPRGYWYDLSTKTWIEGGTTIERTFGIHETGMYVRDGSIIPTFSGTEFHEPASRDFSQVEFTIYLNSASEAELTYYEDDGISFDYRKGIYNEYLIKASVGKKGTVEIGISAIHKKYKKGVPRFQFTIIQGETVSTQTKSV